MNYMLIKLFRTDNAIKNHWNSTIRRKFEIDDEGKSTHYPYPSLSRSHENTLKRNNTTNNSVKRLLNFSMAGFSSATTTTTNNHIVLNYHRKVFSDTTVFNNKTNGINITNNSNKNTENTRKNKNSLIYSLNNFNDNLAGGDNSFNNIKNKTIINNNKVNFNSGYNGKIENEMKDVEVFDSGDNDADKDVLSICTGFKSPKKSKSKLLHVCHFFLVLLNEFLFHNYH